MTVDDHVIECDESMFLLGQTQRRPVPANESHHCCREEKRCMLVCHVTIMNMMVCLIHDVTDILGYRHTARCRNVGRSALTNALRRLGRRRGDTSDFNERLTSRFNHVVDRDIPSSGQVSISLENPFTLMLGSYPCRL